MAALSKRWYRSRRNQLLVIIFILGLLAYSTLKGDSEDLDITKRSSIIAYIDNKLQEQLKLDKGTGCEMPNLDPFAKEVTQFDKEMPKVKCDGQDWVKCYLSECKVVGDILETYSDITCTYRDIVYESDEKYSIGAPNEVRGGDVYRLTESDHVKISCTGSSRQSFLNIIPVRWTGHATGFRSTVTRHPTPKDREDTINVLIFGFDSTAKNGFIRRMPKSYKYLTENLHATVLQGYNIVGDGTPAALFPILTGKNELELPDARKKMRNNKSCDDMPFLFYKLRDDGYRTAYFEDMPWIGTFQYRFTGFRRQPADHYLRAFLLEESARGKRWWGKGGNKYCVGDTPQYKLMMNLTNQFFHLDGKKFAFTFVADITHDDFNMISTADDDFVEFMERFKSDGFLKDTMFLVMGDHGPRYAHVRNTLQGKLEERLPLLAIVLPERIRSARPTVLRALRDNVHALSTPHDVHAMLLDALHLRQHWNLQKVPGADLPRGLTLFEPIPRNRSCSEAGIEPHWCACLAWQNVSHSDPMYRKATQAFVDFINSLTEPVRSKCAMRTLASVSWVMKQLANSRMLSFVEAKDTDGYVGKFGEKIHLQKETFQVKFGSPLVVMLSFVEAKDTDGYVGKFGEKIHLQKETYQVKITVGPGSGDFEASMTYLVDKDEFHVDGRDVSRTNMYGNEPDCISRTHPHLNPYCYCV